MGVCVACDPDENVASLPHIQSSQTYPCGQELVEVSAWQLPQMIDEGVKEVVVG